MKNEAIKKLIALAESTIDQSVTHDGLANCDIIAAARAAVMYDDEREKADEEKTRNAREQAAAQYASIAEMVAALECDYDHLDELREFRDEWEDEHPASFIEPNDPRAAGRFGLANPYEAEELLELEAAAGDCTDEEDARERIQEDPLSIEVRSGWYTPGDEPEPEEFQILLCTGGPAVRIVGELDQYRQPCRAWLEYQDWFTPWIEYYGEEVNSDVLLTYCQQFYFGE